MFLDLGILNDVLDAFQQATAGWVFTLYGVSVHLFFLLGSLELTWSGIRYALSSHDSGLFGFFELAFRKLFYLGFVFWLLEAAPALTPLIISSFQKAGGLASGTTALRPSTFLATGVAIAADYISQMNLLGLLLDPFAVLIAAIGVFLIVLSFAAMAAIITVTLVESYLAIGANFILLAFAASRWTAGIAQGAVTNVLRIGVKLFVLYLVSAVVAGLTQGWADLVNSSDWFVGPFNLLTLVGTSVILALLLWLIPTYAARIVPAGLTLGLSPSVGDN
ncbi:MAG TPA: P-type conjugative transfer protein TrbL [Acidobacteria bacterium]|nr:P-type conjugative transfer protein TrbL [Acidobacteriota bacterium]